MDYEKKGAPPKRPPVHPGNAGGQGGNQQGAGSNQQGGGSGQEQGGGGSPNAS